MYCETSCSVCIHLCILIAAAQWPYQAAFESDEMKWRKLPIFIASIYWFVYDMFINGAFVYLNVQIVNLHSPLPNTFTTISRKLYPQNMHKISAQLNV